MRQNRPLPDTHPELTVYRWPGFTEYRVEHWRLARDGSGTVVRGTHVWSWLDLTVLVIVFSGTFQISVSRAALVISCGVALACIVWTRCTQIIYESVLVFPTLGIQLETHRGHPLLHRPLSTARHFIPLSALEDVVIHEGFRRWNVRYYLAALRRVDRRSSAEATISPDGASNHPARRQDGGGGIEVRVAFENVLPYFPILHVVYLGIQETLFPQPTRVMEMETPPMVSDANS